MKRRHLPQSHRPSDAEVWAAIRYLEKEPPRSVADVIVFMALAWTVLLACSIYVATALGR